MADGTDDYGDADEEAASLPLRENILRDILASGFSHGTKLMPAALGLSSILVRAFIEEAVARAAAEAQESGDEEIRDEHLEKILPQLLLDMGP